MSFTSQDTLTTLVVKHLPEFITSNAELQHAYFKPYNAINARYMQGPAMVGFVFVDFNNRATAEKAYEALKTVNFGLYYKQIVVEFAKPNPKRKINSYGPTKEENERAAEPIAPALGVKYPSNPHLRYKYPDPTPDILGNITNAMGSVPRFYTQVLHLMNKLNLSPPFGPPNEQIIPANLRKRKKDELLASDESELSEDSDEELTAAQQEQMIKRARLSRMAAEQQKQALKSAPKSIPTVKPPPEEQDKIKIVLKKTEAQQAIKDQCKPFSELTEWAAFKNYQAGTPSNKLYIKNLSKKTTEKDLQDIFSLFSSSNIDIQLMTKGRLREQAFITFPDKESAATALECTNGYVVMDRPMAVMFGRSEK